MSAHVCCHHPALGVLGVVLQARRRPRDQRFELLRAQSVPDFPVGGPRRERPWIADGDVLAFFDPWGVNGTPGVTGLTRSLGYALRLR